MLESVDDTACALECQRIRYLSPRCYRGYNKLHEAGVISVPAFHLWRLDIYVRTASPLEIPVPRQRSW